MDERYSRNEGLFGKAGQERIGAAHVAIVGLGGLGSHVAQQLAYLGSQRFDLIDFDVVTDSSLNRLIGAVDDDIAGETTKVAVAKRMIEQINPSAEVAPLEAKAQSPEAIAAIKGADVVFGCLDRDLPRLIVTEWTSRFAIPYFDLATDTGGEGAGLWYGGRLVVANGDGCLLCLGLLDQEEINRDRESPEEREIHDRIYGVDQSSLAGTGPMVVSVNGVVASLAVTEFIALVTGIREPVRHLIYRGQLGQVGRSKDDAEPDCYLCRGLRGTGG